MSFTAKHYTETARIIRDGRTFARDYTRVEGQTGPLSRNFKLGYNEAMERVQSDLRRMFAADNPRFDAKRFDTACEPKGNSK